MEHLKSNFEKKSLLINEQIKLLLDRGLIITDMNAAGHCLSTVGYYRLSAYFRPFFLPNNNEHKFKNGVTFEQIWEIYVFDRELRLHVSDALERIEIALRASLSNAMSYKYGNLWYLSKKPFCQRWLTSPKQIDGKKKKLSPHQYFLNEIKEICNDKKEDFVKHYYNKYNNPKYPPSWMIMECLSFGKCTSLFRNLSELTDKKTISKVFGYHPRVIESSLEPLRYTRNLCAHHSRLWNRWFIYAPKHLDAFGNFESKPNSFHMQAFLIDKLNEAISPGSKWKERLFNLFEKFSNYVPFEHMGYQSDWKNDLFWR